MIIRKERKLTCRRCKKRVTVRSYEGLDPDAWYIDGKEFWCSPAAGSLLKRAGHSLRV